MRARNSADARNQKLIDLRDTVIDRCNELLPLFEEAFPKASLGLAELYRLIGESYKWCPTNQEDCRSGLIYLEKVQKIWETYKHNRSIQTQLAHLLVDLGGTCFMQNDYESALRYRLEALKTITAIENPDLETVGKIEVALLKVYEKTRLGKAVRYDHFLEENGLSTVIESVREQPLENGWCDVHVKIRGMKESCIWRMTQ